MKSTRKLRITRRWRPQVFGPGTSVPEIRLTGQWLARLGFETGAAVRLDVEAGRIVIRLA